MTRTPIPYRRRIAQPRKAAQLIVEHRHRLRVGPSKYNVKIAFGTDTLFDAASLPRRQGAQLAKLTLWFTPAEILKMATTDNAELLALSGLRNPYPGKLGVVEQGALADLFLVEATRLRTSG